MRSVSWDRNALAAERRAGRLAAVEVLKYTTAACEYVEGLRTKVEFLLDASRDGRHYGMQYSTAN